MTNSGPQRTHIGKPEASITFTITVRLGGQFSAAPRTVFDQSLERTRSTISGGSGMPAGEWRDIVVFKKISAPVRSAQLTRVRTVSFQGHGTKQTAKASKAYTPSLPTTVPLSGPTCRCVAA